MAKRSKSTKKIGIPLTVVILLAALVFGAVVGVLVSPAREQIVTLLKQNAQSGTGGDQNNNATFEKGQSVLGGSASFRLPVELDEASVMEAHFIDVGQGDCILLRFNDGVDMIIDAGSGTARNPATVTTEMLAYLDSIQLDKLDYMIATHPHSDHMNMLDDVLKAYEVDHIYYNGWATDEKPTTAYFGDFLEAVDAETGAEIVQFDANGDVYEIEGEGYTVTIYAPGYARFEDTNYMSPMIVVEYGGRRMLLTGDAEEEVELWWMETMGGTSYDIDILKVGHHGSQKGTSDAFLEFIDPEYCVIMVGEENGTYKHPDYLTMNDLFNAGVVTYRTNRHGNIVLFLDGNGEFGFAVEQEVPVDNNKDGINDRMIVTEKAAA